MGCNSCAWSYVSKERLGLLKREHFLLEVWKEVYLKSAEGGGGVRD